MMTKQQANQAACEAIEHLQRCKVGSAPGSVRAEHRQAANDIMARFTVADMRKIDEPLFAMLGDLA